MTGFDKAWLAVREPADLAARNKALMGELARFLAADEQPHILDIGCGTGSTWRSLSDHVPGSTSWRLVDYDPALLAEAARSIGAGNRVEFRQHDLNNLAGLPLDGVSAVTASALLDLCSERFCDALSERLSVHGCALYAALNYDGVMRWSVDHALDGQVVDLFNRHQRRDKGFGPALGPDATSCMAEQLTARGYLLRIEDSPWELDARTAALQTELLKGLRQPLLEMRSLGEQEIDDWLAFRLAALKSESSTCTIGHKDLFGLPA